MKRRTSQEIESDLSKTLYIRLPHTIKNAKEIQELFLGDVKVKMPRQSSRYCHVVFANVEDKMKNLKCIKKLVIDGKHIIACPPKLNPQVERKKDKKVKVPKPKPELKVTKSLYISNIKPGTKAQAVRDAFPGCISMVMLKSKTGKNHKAILKLGSVQLAGEYLRKEREWPEVGGNRLVIKPDTRKRSNSTRKKTTGLKIYDCETSGEKEETKKPSKQKKDESAVSQDSEDEEAEEDDEEEVEQEDSNSDEDAEVDEE